MLSHFDLYTFALVIVQHNVADWLLGTLILYAFLYARFGAIYSLAIMVVFCDASSRAGITTPWMSFALFWGILIAVELKG